jgi:hypothetical protein
MPGDRLEAYPTLPLSGRVGCVETVPRYVLGTSLDIQDPGVWKASPCARQEVMPMFNDGPRRFYQSCAQGYRDREGDLPKT